MWQPQSEIQVLEAVREALSQKTPLSVVGHNSKQNYGRPATASQSLSTANLAGIVDYQPDELIVTVRPGTSIDSLEQELMTQRQHLLFEPADWGPVLGGQARTSTIGGVVAAAVSGPRRLKAGAVRDHLLGLKSVSGRGQLYACGGKVVKNVTGFDLPKLICGSMGTLSVMTEMTLRVGPAPEAELTLLCRDLDAHQAIALMREATTSPTEISAAAHLGQTNPTTWLRLEGPAASIDLRAKALIEELACPLPIELIQGAQSARQWRDIRDLQCFVGNDRPLWKLLLPPSRAALVVTEISQNWPCSVLYDRAGALVWLESCNSDAGESWVRPVAERMGGQATLLRASPALRASLAPFHPESPAVASLSQKIKHAFDPLGILEPDRMVKGR
jgi:glycolate oxidase FAD binding subunit